MTVLELAQRDYANAHRNHQFASLKPNVPAEELARTLELVELRAKILEIVRNADPICPLGGDPEECGDCIYGADYRYVDGRCVRRNCNE